MARPADDPRPAPAPPRAATDLTDAELCAEVEAAGGKPFQARQLSRWLYVQGAAEYSDCTNLPRGLRERLATTLRLRSTAVQHVVASADGTEKMLLRLRDGEAIESVLIPEGARTTLCISTQVGCPVACVFCASGLEGVKRNLSTGEIVEQVLHARVRLDEQHAQRETPGRAPRRALTNLVVMGMGEPLLNLGALLPALERIHDPDGIDLGARRITVSTSGHPERMRQLAEAPHAYNLAVSLHAADDELRRQLVPTTKWRVAEIVAAARHYFEKKGREVTFEVVLLAGVNDRPRDAAALAATLRGFPCTVNLIPWNPVQEIAGLRRPDPAHVEEFAARLVALRQRVTVRRQRGADRAAACGQLRRNAVSESRASSS